jgi:hypothetical protein
LVGHCLGKAEVAGSNPARGSILDYVDLLRSSVYVPMFFWLIYGEVKLLFCLGIVMVTDESEISVVTSLFSMELNVPVATSER